MREESALQQPRLQSKYCAFGMANANKGPSPLRLQLPMKDFELLERGVLLVFEGNFWKGMRQGRELLLPSTVLLLPEWTCPWDISIHNDDCLIIWFWLFCSGCQQCCVLTRAVNCVFMVHSIQVANSVQWIHCTGGTILLVVVTHHSGTTVLLV